ncbi:MAG: hypothetical protein E7680_03120 [Ruminococcaceae bacterium]|nr:hypothetical protein [Oscillospiraceae bacterium]
MMKNQKARVRIFDFFLLLLVFFSVIGLTQRFGAFGANAKESLSDFSVELLWENVDVQTVDCLAVGEEIRNENGTVFGTVKAIRRTPHEVLIYHEGKEFRKSYPEGTIEDVRLTVLISGRRNNRILLREDGSAVLVGQNLRLYAPRAALSLCVISA